MAPGPGPGSNAFRLCGHMAFFFILPLLAGAAVSATLWMAAGIGGLPPLPTVWIMLSGLAAAFVCLCAVSATFAARILNRVSRIDEENAQFERAVFERVARLEAARDRTKPQPAASLQSAPARLAGTLRSGAWIEPAAPPQPVALAKGDQPAETGNVVQLDPAARIRAQQEKRNRGPAPEVLEAIANARFEAWYQPVFGLPDRKTRYLSGHPYLLPDGSSPLAPQHWLEAAANEGRMPALDRFMLLESLKLCRDLARQEKTCGVIWRFNRASLADKAAWSEILEVLGANKALNGSFLCEVSHADYNDLGASEVEALHGIKDAGFELCLADCGDLQGHWASARPGLFKYVSAQPDVIANAADSGNPRAWEIDCIATGVASEAEAILLIDRDVRLAQGPFLAPPKPLRRDGKGGQTPNSVGLRQP